MTYLRPIIESLAELTSRRLIKWRPAWKENYEYRAHVRGVGWVYFGDKLGVAAFPWFAQVHMTMISYDEYEALSSAIRSEKKKAEDATFGEIMAPVLDRPTGDP